MNSLHHIITSFKMSTVQEQVEKNQQDILYLFTTLNLCQKVLYKQEKEIKKLKEELEKIQELMNQLKNSQS